MKIGIDARFWGSEHTGLGRYVMELVNHILAQDKENEYTIFLRRNYYEKLEFDSARVTKVLADLPHYSLAEQVGFPGLIRRSGVSLMHFPHFNLPLFCPVPYIVTIHDLIKHSSRGAKTTTRQPWAYQAKHLAYRFLVWWGIRRARRVIVPSRFWQEELVNRFGLNRKKIQVIYEGVGKQLKTTPLKAKTEIKKLSLKKPYLLYVGNLYPHKNVEEAVRAASPSLPLVIVAVRNVFQTRFNRWLEKEGLKERVVWLAGLTDAQLAAVYSQAEVFVFPSLLEGFGLPGLEAMAQGTPVLAAKASCLPEIYGQAALYFDPSAKDDLKDKLAQLVSSTELASSFKRKGRVQVKKYSWAKAARETISLYQEAA